MDFNQSTNGKSSLSTTNESSRNEHLFGLGRLLGTTGAIAALTRLGVEPSSLIALHATGNWGDGLSEEDRRANDDAVRNGSRIFSSLLLKGEKVWVITEACDDDGSRSATTILLPREY